MLYSLNAIFNILHWKPALTKPDDSGWGYLVATVNDEQAMQWWLQSLGATIRVEAPQHWREILEDQARQLVAWYGRRY